MEMMVLRLLFQKELRDARRNRWFVLFSAAFGVLALALSYFGLAGLGTFGITGFGRTAASLLHLVMLVVPLLGLLLGAISVAGEREQGTLLTLLAQPVTPAEVLLGKFLGACAAMALTITLGFGASGVLIARAAGGTAGGGYLALTALAMLLGFASVAVGFVVSVLSPRGATAIGVALFVWLALILLADLGLMGTAMVLRLSPSQLLWLALWNPVQAFHLSALPAIGGSLESVGPSGRYAAELFGRWLMPAMTGLLALWVVVPMGVAAWVFRRRGAF